MQVVLSLYSFAESASHVGRHESALETVKAEGGSMAEAIRDKAYGVSFHVSNSVQKMH